MREFQKMFCDNPRFNSWRNPKRNCGKKYERILVETYEETPEELPEEFQKDHLGESQRGLLKEFQEDLLD